LCLASAVVPAAVGLHCWQNRLLTVGSLSQGSVVNRC
jgi:hypothetical protein